MLSTIVLGLLLSLGPAAQEPPDPTCSDDRGVDRCAPDQPAHLQALYAVPPMAAFNTRGESLLRVFYVDGYGADLLAISVVRSARGAELRVAYPAERGGGRAEAIAARLPEAQWRELSSAMAARMIRPPAPPVKGDEVSICLHAWVYRLETASPDVIGRSRVADACNDRAASEYANRLSEVAVALFPACAALDPKQHRNAATRLAACRLLAGDRLSAAAVMNRYRRLPPASFAVVPAGGAVQLYPSRITGLGEGRVQLTGTIGRYGEDKSYTAPVEQSWVRGRDGDYTLERSTAGAWTTPG